MTTSVSSSYLGTALIPSITQTQATLASEGTELSSGQYADLGLQLGSQSGYELSLRNEHDVLQSLTTSNSVVTTNLTVSQDALGSILSAAQSAQASLTTWTGDATASAATLQTVGSSGLQSLVATANTTSNDSYVFGGENSGVAPVADSNTITNTVTQAFQSYFGFAPTSSSAASVTSTQMQSFLSNAVSPLFTSNWSSSGLSSASSINTTAQIAPGETVDTSTNANQPGFSQLAQGYAILAALGGTQLSSSAQQVVASTATSLVTQGVASTTTTESNVGSLLASVSDATSSMSSQMTILQTQIGNLDNVNTTTIATQINQLSTQLETAYQLTDQIQKLSLAQYLPIS